MTNPKLLELAQTLDAAAKRKKFRALDYFKPYPKQQLFFDYGSSKTERLLFAGNQNGKTYAGGFESACHATGQYPKDWLGRRFDRATKGWVAGETGILVRDKPQAILCGQPGVVEAFGTGFIPKDAFVDKPSLARGVTDAYDTIQVRHVSGGVSTITFKSYEQGRTKFQSETLDWWWADEEPPMDIYTELLARISATRGIGYVTFTPLLGMSEVVIRFLNEPSNDREVVTMTIDDAEHIPIEDRAKIIARYPPHEREARARGVPLLGSGRIFTCSEDAIGEPALEYIPPHWRKGWGLDFGLDHPFAAVLLLHDPDNDVVHIRATIRVKDQQPLQHAEAMKPVGRAVPAFWPQDGHQRRGDAGDLKPLATIYKKHGVRMYEHHATWIDGSNSTEAGVTEMIERMESGRLKVARQLGDWWEEYRMYHRKDGLIVKLKDDLMSATRVGIMMLRHFQAVPLGSKEVMRRGSGVARDVDFDLS